MYSINRMTWTVFILATGVSSAFAQTANTFTIQSLDRRVSAAKPIDIQRVIVGFQNELNRKINDDSTLTKEKRQDLYALQTLVAPILELINKKDTERDCEQTRHDIQFMEEFGEDASDRLADEESALHIVELICEVRSPNSVSPLPSAEKKK